MAVLLAAGCYGFYFYTLPRALDEGFIYGNGHIEGTEVRIGAEISGRVITSNLIEGVEVRKNSLLVEIDSREQAINCAMAAAELNTLGHQKNRYQEQLQTWLDTLQTAEKDLTRYQALRKSGVVTEQHLDKVVSTQRDAQGQVRSLQAQIEETQARAEELRHKLDYLRVQVDKAKIFSPINATMLSKGIELGELAEPGRQIVTLVDMNNLELKVYLSEAIIGRIRLGAPARIRVNAFPDRYFTGTVKRIDQRAQFTPRDINLPEERVRMVFGVVLALDNTERFLKPGMPADAWIRWDDKKEWPAKLVIPR